MIGSFNAARGFVGGARKMHGRDISSYSCFNAARGFVGGASSRQVAISVMIPVSMPHAALLVVQADVSMRKQFLPEVSMPHAALLVVQVPSRNLN